jgi:hypothetical protein
LMSIGKPREKFGMYRFRSSEQKNNQTIMNFKNFLK